jgi:hypothetical protein
MYVYMYVYACISVCMNMSMCICLLCWSVRRVIKLDKAVLLVFMCMPRRAYIHTFMSCKYQIFIQRVHTYYCMHMHTYPQVGDILHIVHEQLHIALYVHTTFCINTHRLTWSLVLMASQHSAVAYGYAGRKAKNSQRLPYQQVGMYVFMHVCPMHACMHTCT